jgi:hypothetical protein
MSGPISGQSGIDRVLGPADPTLETMQLSGGVLCFEPPFGPRGGSQRADGRIKWQVREDMSATYSRRFVKESPEVGRISNLSFQGKGTAREATLEGDGEGRKLVTVD